MSPHHHPTPREAASAPVRPAGTPPRVAGPDLTPRGPAQPITGSIADYDDLCEALAVYEAEYALGGHTAHLYGALMDASARCGRPFGIPALGWSTRRVNAYRNMIGA